VTVTHSDHVGNGGELSMEIHVVEAHHRTIAAGVGYSSQRGIGLTAEWDHRNVRSQGERVHAGINIWQNTQEAKLSYTLPDFGCPGRDLIWQADLQHTSTKGYADVSGGVSALLEHTYHERLRFSYGMMYKMISTSHSDNNALFHLWKLPMHLRWSNADSVLNPTVGKSINLKVTPSLQLATPQFFYCPITCTATYYKPLSADRRIVFAAKASLGTILGVTNHAIPPSERFYAGNETTLRGYQYQTVSPLDHQNKPIGGRSMAVGSVELRGMITDTIEGVGFYEIGNVYKNAYPDLMSKPLQSVGAGVRYHTPVGPIRFDVAVPLNPRPGIDKGYQFYMSIGQSF
jgi:translocation and assembly module TamA